FGDHRVVHSFPTRRSSDLVEPIRESRATVKDTRLIEVSFRHTDPDLAAFVVNGIGETFASANQEQRTGTSRKTSDFLQKRISDLDRKSTRLNSSHVKISYA